MSALTLIVSACSLLSLVVGVLIGGALFYLKGLTDGRNSRG